VSDLIGCDNKNLLNALTQRTVTTAGDRVKTDLSSIDVRNT